MSSSSQDLHFLQRYQRRQRKIWLNRLGKEFRTCWLFVLDICHIVADYLIPFPHQFCDSIIHQSDNSDAIIANDRLSVKFEKVYSGILTKWPLWKTSPTIQFRIARMSSTHSFAWIGLRRPDCTWGVEGQWIISKDGCVLGDPYYTRNSIAESSPRLLQFKTNDLITIKCDFERGKVYFSKNKSKHKHLVFQNVANLQSLHFCVEGCLVDFAIK